MGKLCVAVQAHICGITDTLGTIALAGHTYPFHSIKPSPSTLSISNLGLSRPFPSSRSFLHLPPSSYPQSPGPGPPPSQDTLSPTSATDRHRDAFDGERSRDSEGAALATSQKDGNGSVTSKPNRRPLFSEQDVQLITRNAAELLATHETFVKMLKYALEPLGLNDLLSSRFEAKKMSSEGKEDVENAVKAVTELFCQQASAFEIYESFCPGTTKLLISFAPCKNSTRRVGRLRATVFPTRLTRV
ncbi:hypothetical protein BC629DRAFT_497551 [Irpex lacteus]|nr:hypothetical protein BC629DRAFT_497551 [Irpex lacteus]